MAIANNPDRGPRDEADILEVLKLFKNHLIPKNFGSLDMDRIFLFADRFGQRMRIEKYVKNVFAVTDKPFALSIAMVEHIDPLIALFDAFGLAVTTEAPTRERDLDEFVRDHRAMVLVEAKLEIKNCKRSAGDVRAVIGIVERVDINCAAGSRNAR